MWYVARVLLLEPDPDVREFLARSLVRLGHEALENGSAEVPDLILVEPAAPSSVRAARSAREANPDVPVVCASIYPRQQIPADFRSAPYLVKPISLGKLDEALRSALT
jgi:CheY-like chemotaxis protein